MSAPAPGGSVPRVTAIVVSYNTIYSSFEHSVMVGADAHDNTVDRTTNGKGEVANMTFDEIRRLEVRGGGKIPTFDEALSLAEGKIGVYVDCKRISPRDVVEALSRPVAR